MYIFPLNVNKNVLCNFRVFIWTEVYGALLILFCPKTPKTSWDVTPAEYLLFSFYRPQRSCEGYVFTGVCLPQGRGWYPSMPCRWYPSMPCSRSWGRCAIPVCIAGGIPACLATGLQGWCLVQGVAWSRRVSAPGGTGIPACTEADPPPLETATAADGTHPTGMHSC